MGEDETVWQRTMICSKNTWWVGQLGRKDKARRWDKLMCKGATSNILYILQFLFLMLCCVCVCISTSYNPWDDEVNKIVTTQPLFCSFLFQTQQWIMSQQNYIFQLFCTTIVFSIPCPFLIQDLINASSTPCIFIGKILGWKSDFVQSKLVTC